MTKNDIAWYNIYNTNHGEWYFTIDQVIPIVRQTGYTYFTWNGMIIKYGAWMIVAHYDTTTMEITPITPKKFGT